MKRTISGILPFAMAAVLVHGGMAAAENPSPKHTFAIGTNDFLLDGKPFVIRCGEIHAPRVPGSANLAGLLCPAMPKMGQDD